MVQAIFGRRDVLAGATAATVAAIGGSPAFALGDQMRFPKGFRWGASTAGHQIEGNNVNSDLWFLENLPATTFKDRSGDACDSYHRFDDDIDLLRRMGLNAYRFSIEWSRVEPSRGHFSLAEIEHYRRQLAALRKAGIDPVVTFFHVAAPRWFAEAGGWLNPEAPDLFANFCDKVTRALGDGIAQACTINEPQVGLTYRAFSAGGNYFKDADARELKVHEEARSRTGATRFITMNHPDIRGMTPQLIAGHEKAFAAIKAVRSDLPTGVTLNLVDFQPGNEGSEHLKLREIAYGEWMAAARRAGDFIGVQTYRQILIPGAGAKLPALPAMPFVKAEEMTEVIKQPSALQNTVEYAYQQTRKPIFVTENGIETDNDARRVWYIPQALAALHAAIAKGIPVIGYMHWSLIDNFEWTRGYDAKFGLASVNRETFQRTLKPSAAVYGKIVKANAI